MTTTLQQLKEKILQNPETKALYDADTLTIKDVETVFYDTETLSDLEADSSNKN